MRARDALARAAIDAARDLVAVLTLVALSPVILVLVVVASVTDWIGQFEDW